MTLKEMINTYLGKSTDIDGAAGVQCVDVAKLYLEKVLGLKTGAWGNACQWWEGFNNVGNLRNNFTKVVNEADTVPKAGWIVIWKPSIDNGYCGHIAVCTGVGNVNTFQSVDQNYNGKAMKYVTHNYSNLYGFLKPNANLQSKITGATSTTTSTAKPTTTSTSTTKPASSSPTYVVGKNYTLIADLNVRSGAGVNYTQKKRAQLSADGQYHALNQTYACLKAGTVVTIKSVKRVGRDVWIEIPSGWLAAYYDNHKYIK